MASASSAAVLAVEKLRFENGFQTEKFFKCFLRRFKSGFGARGPIEGNRGSRARELAAKGWSYAKDRRETRNIGHDGISRAGVKIAASRRIWRCVNAG
jgi:hypothetical protein